MISSFLKWLKENWQRVRFSHIFYGLLVFVVLYFVSGEIKYRYQKNHLEKLSPKQIVNLSVKAQWKKDHELLKKIVHSSNNYEGERKKSQVEENADRVEIFVRILFGIKNRAYYQKIMDPNTAEVGIVMYSMYWPFAKARVGMDILKVENGIWKIHSSKWKWGEMLEYLRQNPTDLSSYYLCSCDMANNQNSLLDYRFRKKYYELDPRGFWITKSFLQELEADEENYEINYAHYENQLLAKMASPGNSRQAKEICLIELARIFMFHQDYQKAEKYLKDADNLYKQGESKPYYFMESFNPAREELRLRKEGKYVDPLEELDKLRLAKEKQK